jgi:tRNA pseudouridine38-40 synthase
MRKAAKILEGKHDFRAYSQELEGVENAVRELFEVKVTQRRSEIHFDILGTAFVRGMMRRMSGMLLQVGRGSRPVEHAGQLLDPERRNDLQWPEVLPACGLTLMRVRHGKERIDLRDNALPLVSG